MTAVRIRGIYTTALTRLLRQDGLEVVQPSPPIRERFEDGLDTVPADVRIDTSRDRQGVSVSGDPDGVEAVAARLADAGIDAFRWADDAPHGAVFDAEVIATDGGGSATVDLGDGRRGYLPYDAVSGYVGDGDRYRVQVREPASPWGDDRARVEPGLSVGGGLCSLSRDRSGISAAVGGERGEELVGLTDLLSVEVPEGWGLRWERGAADATLEAMGEAVADAVDRAGELEATLDDAPAEPGDPGVLAEPEGTVWCWFGRESRFALDDSRRAVTATMAGHHRIKAGSSAASSAVDFAEAVCGGDGEFPFGAVAGQFGPEAGDRIALGHGKPDGRLITLGTGTVTDWSGDGSVSLEREMTAGGTYDALEVPIEAGDVAVTKLREGRWWYPTTYRDSEGVAKGTYVNVCTPVELFPDCARYVDLYVDVIRRADGSVAVVDEDELAEAVADGLVDEELAEKARNVASAVERALS
ncbi:DUF402 domain-containing protein [Saliphagus sp. LR7]|uniref:DUF402 domain-containing protein n=1 Tax=Saliphagus sp. LR7 TaxID=2282654 RepID=UPI000DF781A2|nr:DUF402 domain-containing protein [Saliphagus sp. LR7]